MTSSSSYASFEYFEPSAYNWPMDFVQSSVTDVDGASSFFYPPSFTDYVASNVPIFNDTPTISSHYQTPELSRDYDTSPSSPATPSSSFLSMTPPISSPRDLVRIAAPQDHSESMEIGWSEYDIEMSSGVSDSWTCQYVAEPNPHCDSGYRSMADNMPAPYSHPLNSPDSCLWNTPTSSMPTTKTSSGISSHPHYDVSHTSPANTFIPASVSHPSFMQTIPSQHDSPIRNQAGLELTAQHNSFPPLFQPQPVRPIPTILLEDFIRDNVLEGSSDDRALSRIYPSCHQGTSNMLMPSSLLCQPVSDAVRFQRR